MTHADQATRRAIRSLGDPSEHHRTFVATEGELLAGDHKGVVWQQCGSGLGDDPPVRISPDASLPGILAWAERLLGAADRLDGPPIITSNVETLAGRGILGDSWRLPSPHPSERRPLSSLDPVAE